MSASVTRWLQATALVVGVPAIGVLSSATANPAGQGVQASEIRTLEVVATRYAFEPAEIEAIAGERIRILVKSGDGLHGFEIKKFKVSKEIPRGGDPVTIEFTPTEAGRFPILCSVFCGDGHDAMKGALIVSARTPTQP